MKNCVKWFNLGALILAMLFVVCSFTIARAQEPNFPPPQDIGIGQPPPPQRPNLLRELNLSQPQIRQIQQINREKRPLLQESQRRFREATQALDEAVYADADNEAVIESRIKDVHAAHIEVIRNRTMLDLAIRRILTPGQLLRFRNLRGEFMQNRPPANQISPRQDQLRNLPKGIRQNNRLKRQAGRPN